MGENGEDLEKLLEEEGIELEEEKPDEIKRKIKVAEKELKNVSNAQWAYVEEMLQFGWSAWILGIVIFVSTLLLYEGPGLIVQSPALSISLVTFAGAIPVLISVVLVQRYQRKIERLNRIRKELLSKYEKTVLKKVEDNIA